MIRKGKHDDVRAIVVMASDFWQHTAYDDPYCPETVASMAFNCIQADMMSVLEVDGDAVGFACGVIGPLLGNKAVLSGTEIAWWVTPAHRSGRNGIGLLKHLESLAKEAGVKYWNMAFMQSSMPDYVERIYQKLGYEKTEVIYSRELI